MMRACNVCGRPIPNGTRCPAHALTPRRRDRAYTQLARAVVQAATHCALCGGPPRLGDPFVCDHIVPLAHGGTSELSNMQAAHRSCNGRKGQSIGEGNR